MLKFMKKFRNIETLIPYDFEVLQLCEYKLGKMIFIRES